MMQQEDCAANASNTLQEEFENSIKLDVQDRIREMRTQKWQEFLKQKTNSWTTAVSNLNVILPQAKNKTPFHTLVPLDVEGIRIKKVVVEGDCGLEVTVADDYKSFAIDGIPVLKDATAAMDVLVVVEYCHNDLPDLKLPPLKLKMSVNPLPKDLWRDLPVPENIEYPKRNEECEWINATMEGNKTVIAASKRGRSHAHEGKPRDDHFSINITEDGWFVLVVADGAGSAPFSREGSRIACETTNKICVNQLADKHERLEQMIKNYVECDGQKEKDSWRKKVGDLLYACLATAAYIVHSDIKGVAKAKQRLPKDYATTLLMAIAKKMDGYWFVGSFNIGDGAIGLYNATDNSVKLLCEPDEGEFSGQTRFVTMNDMFMSATNIYMRLRFQIVNDFSSLMLMSDGVSDVYFETENNLKDAEHWKVLERDILLATNPGKRGDVSTETQAKRLLSWLDFWSPGNHDDRTIVVLH